MPDGSARWVKVRAVAAERAASASLLAAAVLAGVAFVTSRPSSTPGGDSLGPARGRIAMALALRARAPVQASGERFDRLIASLRAGLGHDTPAALGPALGEIQTARAREAARGSNAPAAAGPEVDQGLARADAILTLLAEQDRTGAPRASPDAVNALVGAAAALVAFGAGCTEVARRRRRAERARVASLLGLDARACDEESLADEVGLALARAGGAAPAPRRPPARVEPQVSPRVGRLLDLASDVPARGDPGAARRGARSPTAGR
jgi:hypothetical protein